MAKDFDGYTQMVLSSKTSKPLLRKRGFVWSQSQRPVDCVELLRVHFDLF
jgi:hypothetical protein